MEKIKSFKSFRNRAVDLANEENAAELLEAQGHIWNHIFNFINSMSLKCAIQLGVFDTVHANRGKPMTLSQLTSNSPVNPAKSPCLYRLMRVLVHAGFFSVENTAGDGGDQRGYVLTKASELLLKDNPFCVAPFLLAVLDPALTKPWDHLSAWFGNDEPTAFGTANGASFWEYGSREPGLARFFNEAMASDARLVASVVVERCRGVFEGVETLVDVGGGTGTVAKAVADGFPSIECVVFDLPHVVADAALDGGAGGNLKFVGGDMFDAVPPGDAILLKWILHDWNDEDSVKILKKCKEAIQSKGSEKGKVIIIDMMVENKKVEEEDESFETQLFFDMTMMVLVNGKERNQEEWAQLFNRAGFNRYKITPVLGLRSLIEVYP